MAELGLVDQEEIDEFVLEHLVGSLSDAAATLAAAASAAAAAAELPTFQVWAGFLYRSHYSYKTP